MRRLRLILFFVLPVAGIASWYVWNETSRVDHARYLIESGQFTEAREELARYLGWFPDDTTANFLMAETMIKDESQVEDDIVQQAIVHLQIAAHDPAFREQSLLHEGRLRFLLLSQPFQAEALFRTALEERPDNYAANWLLWKLLDMTMRAHLSEPFFWRCFELADASERPQLLRDWYLSQFSPGTANADLDRMIGVLEPTESPGTRIELRRLAQFRSQEPKEILAHAAFAAWCRHARAVDVASEALDESISLATNEPFYLATVLQVRLDSGDFAGAAAAFEHWPDSDRSFDYWKCRGLLAEEVHDNHRDAEDAYRRAALMWPGQCDASLQHRRSNCLMRLGRKDDAEQCREAAKRIDDLMELGLHARLRQLLLDLTSPTALTETARFYQQLGRQREAKEWLSLASVPTP